MVGRLLVLPVRPLGIGQTEYERFDSIVAGDADHSINNSMCRVQAVHKDIPHAVEICIMVSSARMKIMGDAQSLDRRQTKTKIPPMDELGRLSIN